MSSVRTVRREDLAALLELYVHLNPDNASLPDDALLQPAWERILSDPNMYCFVADTDGVLTGSCLLAVVPNLTRGARPFGVIENVVIHIEYRRQGIGTRLMSHALQTAWDAGCYKVMLLSGAWREEAHRFYEELGFMREGKVGFVAAAPVVPETKAPAAADPTSGETRYSRPASRWGCESDKQSAE